MRRFVWCAIALMLAGGVWADERILRFDSDITVKPDGVMIVRETIKVRSEALQINHGIYRDIPIQYQDTSGAPHDVRLRFLDLTRDGKPEDHHSDSSSSEMIRFYFGKRMVTLPPGEYTYVFTYKIEDEIGYFPEHDELYWNVTGNGWQFPIDAASVKIRLPQPVPASDLRLDGYTGPEGAKGTLYEDEVTEPGCAWFASTQPLEPHEGLTVCVGFPKGIVHQPDPSERKPFTLSNSPGALAAFAGLFLVFAYYFVIWALVGKDPSAGPILPREAPPEGFSPAMVRYLRRMGFDSQAFTAALVNMAVKGHFRIEEADGKYFLARDASGEEAELSREEYKVKDILLGGRDEFVVEQKNHTTLSSAMQACKKSLELAVTIKYFQTNRKYFYVGLALSIAVAAGSAVLSVSADNIPPAIFMAIWLSGWTTGVAFLTVTVLSLWKSALGGAWSNIPGAIFMTAFATPFFAGECFGAYMMSAIVTPEVVGALMAIGLVNLIFFKLLKAPTALGRRVLDEIEGFRTFLSGNHCFGPDADPEESSQRYQQFLPYAIALDQEKGWSLEFNNALEKAGISPQDHSYSPRWYTGNRWDTAGATGLAAGLGSAFASTVSSASTSPSSRSGGGGGGSSGGGGGGGGGGGW